MNKIMIINGYFKISSHIIDGKNNTVIFLDLSKAIDTFESDICKTNSIIIVFLFFKLL